MHPLYLCVLGRKHGKIGRTSPKTADEPCKQGKFGARWMCLSRKRNTDLDGWRCIAVLGVMWLHWSIPKWRGWIPFEMGIYFFFTLTGYLITQILLRDREKGEASGQAWKAGSLRIFQSRRALRILVPCWAAMIFGLIVLAPDLWAHPLLYFAQVSNFHIAQMADYPMGTAHYWTLAIQQQFYLIWPFLIFWVPKKWMAWVFTLIVLVAPLSRLLLNIYYPDLPNPGAITLCAMDYFGCGALLALALQNGVDAGDKRIRIAGIITGCCYTALYLLHKADQDTHGLGHLQQTFLAVAMAALIAATIAGLPAPISRVLSHPWVQWIGKISYSIYLLHCLVPLALGKIIPPLWWIEGELGTAIRLVVFAAASLALSWASWRWIEQPIDRFRSKIRTS